ncbi:tyrosine-type recombinase/integrase [Flavobacterium sp. ZB4P13]|uniref:tyrosine-type recombinase/integrase n=1 Tax=Flavobacterium sp. ZB4P13 TaxID=3401728 RepID=UPI003AADCBB1
MKYTFKLKEPNSAKETSILFSCFFKNENKKFIYSTGEKIHPNNWDVQNKFPFTNGKNKSKFAESIKMQLNRYSDLMQKTESQYKKINEAFTTKTLKKVFDEEFKKALSGKNIFFDAFDEFMASKIDTMQWSKGTKTRYQNIKNILKNFEVAQNYSLTFSKIDTNFYSLFLSYCLNDLNHINNTYLKNLALFKTFMFWALKNKYTYNNAFENFNIDDNGKTILKPTLTKQIALTVEDLKKLMQHEFKSKRLEKSRDLFVFECVTGLRYSEMHSIKRSNVTDEFIILKEEKDETKEAREIPLTSFSRFILSKYDYTLPMITNQKQNKFIKEVFEEVGYTNKVEKVTTKGKENIKVEMIFKDRISTHTGRRTFVTVLISEKIHPKMIAKMTGHTDLETMTAYYHVSEPEIKKAMDEVFDIEIPLKKVDEN